MSKNLRLCLFLCTAGVALTLAFGCDEAATMAPPTAKPDAAAQPATAPAPTIPGIYHPQIPPEPVLAPEVRQRVDAMARMAMDSKPADRAAMLAGLADTEPLVRRHAIYGLERLGDPADVKAIIPLLKDGDAWVRRNAAIALGKLGSREAVAPLVAALGDDDLRLRYEALLALARLGDPAAQKPIIEAFKDRRLWVAPGIDPVSVLHTAERDFFTDRDVIAAVKELFGSADWDLPEIQALTPAKRASQAADLGLQAAAFLAIKFGDASGEDYLLPGLSSGSDYTKQLAARALGSIRSKRAVPGLTKLLGDEWVTTRYYAVWALGRSGDPAAVEPLRPHLAAPVLRLRRATAEALTALGAEFEAPDLSAPAAVLPEIPADQLGTPGGKRPPQFICLGVDDNVNIEGLEAMLDICETLQANGSKAVFTLYAAPWGGDSETRDLVKQQLLYQKLFDLGCEFANHTLDHNKGGLFWAARPPEEQVRELEGCTTWLREHIDGFTRPFSHKGGGGATGGTVDRNFTAALMEKQKFLYRGWRGQHPNDQMWPMPSTRGRAGWMLPTGCLDAAAPPVHATITDPIVSDYSGRFDFDVPAGVAMWKANFDYHWRHPRRPILAVDAFHDWGFKTVDDSRTNWSHRNEAPILKAFLMDVLVKSKDEYPDTYCVTFRQVIEYAVSGGDLEHTLKAGNCQDSRNPEKPLIP